MSGVGRTLAALAALAATLPVDLVITALALARHPHLPPALARHPHLPPAPHGRTVLVTGGKMTKALTLARAFAADGHRVVLVESPRYRFGGHRFSRAVHAFHCVPPDTDPAYPQALADIVAREGVDVVVPVSAPAASVPEARAGELLAGVCEIVHGDVATTAMLDDKTTFCATAAGLGLRVPDSHRITDAAQVEAFDFPPGRAYVLKRVAYNPVGRLDLTRLTRETPARNAAFARGLGISPEDPWILQEFVEGPEYCTHSTVRDGRVQVYACCASSAAQVNYGFVDVPEIRAWVEHFVGALRLTGQVSFDFIVGDDGAPVAIECNPRTHSAITMFAGHPELAAAYLDPAHRAGDRPAITPLPTSRPTYWAYHEAWRLLRGPRRRATIATLSAGRDAVFSARDPLPYLLLHHLQIPSLLLGTLRRRGGWTRIDFNIGKLVETGGD